MKRLSKKVLEARMQDIMNEPTPADFERFETMKERVYAECVRRSDSEEVVPAKYTVNKRSYHHYVMAAVVMAIAFIFVPVIYTALFPVTVSNANNVMRRAGVWINNTLRLGIEFPEPIDDDNHIETPKEVGFFSFSTAEEAAEFLGQSILALDLDFPGLSLVSVGVNVDENNIFQVNLDYSYNSLQVFLTCESIVTDMAISPHVDAVEVITSVGPLFYWSTDTMHRATNVIDTWNVQIRTDSTVPNAVELFQTLRRVN